MSHRHHSRSAARFALVMGLATGLVACSSGAGTSVPTSRRIAVTTTTSTLPRPAPTVASKATRGFPSSEEAVDAFLDDWEHDRKADIYQIADAGAVVGVYQTPAGPPSQDRGCTNPVPGLPTGGCVFLMAGEAGLLTVSTEQRPVGWVVTDAVYAPCTPDNPCG